MIWTSQQKELLSIGLKENLPIETVAKEDHHKAVDLARQVHRHLEKNCDLADIGSSPLIWPGPGGRRPRQPARGRAGRRRRRRSRRERRRGGWGRRCRGDEGRGGDQCRRCWRGQSWTWPRPPGRGIAAISIKLCLVFVYLDLMCRENIFVQPVFWSVWPESHRQPLPQVQRQSSLLSQLLPRLCENSDGGDGDVEDVAVRCDNDEDVDCLHQCSLLAWSVL